MRIPTSVIVMSLVTAVPFGLAIRDTLRHPSPSEEDDDLLDFDGSRAQARAEREAEEEYAKELQREAQEVAANRAKRTQLLPRLVGSQPASLGSLFAGVQLGASAGDFQPEPTRKAIQDVSDIVSVSYDVDAVHLNGVRILLAADDDCEDLADLLTRTWGEPSGDTWADPATHQRAQFDELSCSLRIERYADVTQWLDRTDTAIVPLDAIGKPAAKLRERIGGLLTDDDDDTLSWHDLGTGRGHGDTELSATLVRGKVAGLSVYTDGDAETVRAVRDRLTKLLGTKPAEDPDTGDYVWKGRVPAHLANEDDGGVSLELGTP